VVARSSSLLNLPASFVHGRTGGGVEVEHFEVFGFRVDHRNDREIRIGALLPRDTCAHAVKLHRTASVPTVFDGRLPRMVRIKDKRRNARQLRSALRPVLPAEIAALLRVTPSKRNCVSFPAHRSSKRGSNLGSNSDALRAFCTGVMAVPEILAIGCVDGAHPG
jgi:hypothetical protein